MSTVAPADEARVLEMAADVADDFEGFSSTPYLCPAKVWTIGYGSTRDHAGHRVIRSTPAITREAAHLLMIRDLRSALQCINSLVRVNLDPVEEAALISFIYNVGEGAFAKSTLLRKINADDLIGAGAEFAKWNQGGGKVLAGLVRRRAAERALFDRDL